jgi:hypothetical protein
MSITSIKSFKQSWSDAREDKSEQGHFVSYGEMKKMEQALKGSDGKISNAEALALAEQINEDTVLTRPAEKEVRDLFADRLGSNHRFDALTREAVKADFSMRATGPFQSLDVPGRALTSERSLDALPRSVTRALGELAVSPDFSWESSEVRKAKLAGQDVLIVHYQSEEDPEAVRVFTPKGREIASGGIDDGMAGFFWK